LNELYFDNNATTPLDEAVLEAVGRALAETYANPASRHPLGEKAHAAVDRARSSVARLLGVTPKEIVFTSGGTESIHTALHIALAERSRGHVVTSAVEHPAVLQPLETWSDRAGELVMIGVDGEGRLDTDRALAHLEAHATDVRLVSLLLANNETGVLLPPRELRAIAAAARAAGALVHVDAVQAPGKVELERWVPHADLVSLSAHKFHGPKGIGALFVREAVEPPRRGFLSGGTQEEARRAGTLNVPGIVGMGVAAERALEHLADTAGRARLEALRDRLEVGLCEGIEDLRVHGTGAPRLPNTTNVGLVGIDGELLHLSLAAEGLCVSGGSACSSNMRRPSPVLLAMGIGDEEARASLRFSLSRRTREDEVERAIEITCRTASELGAVSARARTRPS